MQEFARYCLADGDGDDVPLYIFDPQLSTRVFDSGRFLSDHFIIPNCFSQDALAGCTRSRFRPLPPSWLLVGPALSGTPIHNHPLTVAWNALLAGGKLWVIMPPDIETKYLLLGEDNEEHNFDLAAMEWFLQWHAEKTDRRIQRTLPSSARIIIQIPGETVFVPAGWFHVVLNLKTSTALSHSLALRRDFEHVWPALLKEDKAFGMFWLRSLKEAHLEVLPALIRMHLADDVNLEGEP